MRLHDAPTEKLHLELLQQYKDRLEAVEAKDETEAEEPFERSFIHNAIYLHDLWFEQLADGPDKTEAPLLVDLLKRRESDLGTFQQWMNGFARAARPHGWAVWGWSQSLKTFVGFPIKSHDDKVPLGCTPILVIDCWEHSYIEDFGLDFDQYLDTFWRDINWQAIENRHQELAYLLGFHVK